jgi:hypothetical protein
LYQRFAAGQVDFSQIFDMNVDQIINRNQIRFPDMFCQLMAADQLTLLADKNSNSANSLRVSSISCPRAPQCGFAGADSDRMPAIPVPVAILRGGARLQFWPVILQTRTV